MSASTAALHTTSLLGPPVIILAESDRKITDALRSHFSAGDFLVLVAADGPAAEVYAAGTQACLVVVSSALRGVSGYEACARIRAMEGYSEALIVLTAPALTPKVLAAGRKARVTITISKPYSVDDLIGRVKPYASTDHPLFAHENRPGRVAEGPRRIVWGELKPLRWEHGSESELSRNSGLLPIIRSSPAPSVRRSRKT